MEIFYRPEGRPGRPGLPSTRRRHALLRDAVELRTTLRVAQTGNAIFPFQAIGVTHVRADAADPLPLVPVFSPPALAYTTRPRSAALLLVRRGNELAAIGCCRPFRPASLSISRRARDVFASHRHATVLLRAALCILIRFCAGVANDVPARRLWLAATRLATSFTLIPFLEIRAALDVVTGSLAAAGL